jgi:hypothetical protein
VGVLVPSTQLAYQIPRSSRSDFSPSDAVPGIQINPSVTQNLETPRIRKEGEFLNATSASLVTGDPFNPLVASSKPTWGASLLTRELEGGRVDDLRDPRIFGL